MWLARIALSVATTLGVLRGIPVELEQTDVPPDAILMLSNAKDDLRALATEVLKSQPGNGPAIAPAVHKAMTDALEGNDGGSAEGYGGIDSIDVVAPAGHRNLLAVVVTLGIPCGSDSVLFLFRHDDRWRLVYERREDGYDSISGALGSFQWLVSPPDEQGRFLVLTSSITPWCTSVWHQMHYQVDRVEPGRADAVPIDSGEYTSHEWDVELQIAPDRYAIRFSGSCFDPSYLVRSYELHYVLDGDQPVRVDPIADSPRDFVEEWLGLSDSDAQLRSTIDSETFTELRSEVSSLGGQEEGFDEFGPVTRCSDGAWQVRIDHYAQAEDDEFVPWYFIVTGSNDSFRLSAIGHEPMASCAESSDTIQGANDDDRAAPD
jgi:hypothetical protein